MDEIVRAVVEWGATLIIERWAEILVAVVLVSAWRWFMGRKFTGRIDALEKQLEQPMQPSISVTQVMNTSEPRPTAYDPANGQMFFGTKYGDLSVRFHDADTVIEDINVWLYTHNLKELVSPEAVKTVLRNRIQAQSGK